MLKKIITAELKSKNIIDNQDLNKDTTCAQPETSPEKIDKKVVTATENTSKEQKDDNKA